jgi:hypothetical protein
VDLLVATRLLLPLLWFKYISKGKWVQEEQHVSVLSVILGKQQQPSAVGDACIKQCAGLAAAANSWYLKVAMLLICTCEPAWH